MHCLYDPARHPMLSTRVQRREILWGAQPRQHQEINRMKAQCRRELANQFHAGGLSPASAARNPSTLTQRPAATSCNPTPLCSSYQAIIAPKPRAYATPRSVGVGRLRPCSGVPDACPFKGRTSVSRSHLQADQQPPRTIVRAAQQRFATPCTP